mmetsp:Transcript_2474/g.5296  ORF Transcript_2474/g.5296 Transcript_2474/m.5296 type:complete len:920 (+) Transcript_2474:140-2899(+)|eukprot:CAMPEP_0172552492 /NCGR_PEP_ID=MMETSP1067-20121228/45352_1 /TAXON_ID=265564 ORGANISM="Thalassiosira punctigera, Strain Tpunct2005C2" /NCGR_SAMPLE_ID=MMETSP1067 /ASSEMBLY_ACC=CAM_ASM_000444 /LENGTH=919 /DNA_ID=CAMNT_0013340483 /DNA_START=119 /DNA_END=2878 /DNA_ORIENTATION=+
MRISTYAATAVACSFHLAPASAFLPLRPRVSSNDNRVELRSSLSDQLGSLSYDGAFFGRAAASVTSAAAPPALPKAAVQAAVSGAQAASDGRTIADNLPVPDLGSFADILSSNVGKVTSSPPLTAAEIVDAVVSIVQRYETLADDKLTASLIGDAWTSVKEQLGPLFESLIHPDLPPSVTLLIASYVTYSVVSTALSFGQEPPPNSPYPMNKYDPVSARRYFDGRWGLVLGRAVQVAFLSGTFLSAVALDFLTGKVEANSQARADELSVLLTRLGPSFIKIGQSLSIRRDLLSPAYVRGLKSLQDQVPPFGTAEAREIIESELGSPIEKLFEDFPSEPIAAASLGQVYKVAVRKESDDEGGEGGATTREVAVKVQRPDIMNQIALDMHLIREVMPVLKRTFNLNTDLVGVVDTWGAGFVDELDYIEEAINAKSFTEGITQTPLSGVVFAPPVVDELTTRKVLTTEWVVGERLDKSAKEDVSILCSIAMNSYLTMMLETGLLHCDPHPGNLLRTTDGKLCILDWGMVTRLEPDLQITLIEHMAHLTSADYEEIPKDLLLLGFIPEDKSDLIKDSGVVETLAEIYGAWTAGGGAAAVNVNKVIADLQELTAEKGNLFKIPPYFAYIAKSFSVLEGIGLTNDEKYSIVNECLPYVSKRLLTDKSERTGGALSTFIFGPDKANEDRIIDYDRVEQLVSGFGDYTTSASGELLGKNSTRTDIIEGVATQVLDLLATEEETPLQKIFIEQLAKIITSSTRSAWSDIRERSGVLPSGRTVLGSLVDPLGIFRTSPIVRVNELDERTVETTRNLIQLLATTNSNSADTVDISMLSNAEIVEITSVISRKLFERRSGVLKTSNRLAMQLLQLTADRLEKGGERDIVVVPSNDPVESSSDGRIHEEGNKKDESSDRLASARQILATIDR